MSRADLSQKEWLSLHEASERIGVSPTTLRAWADGGRVQTFRTPGGHRRFRLADVTSLASRPRKRADARWQVLEHSALGRARLALDHAKSAEAWSDQFSLEARAVHRELGRKLLRLLVDVLRGRTVEEETRAKALGREYARMHRRFEIALRDAVEAFIFFRATFLESVLDFSESIGEQKSDEILALYHRLNGVIDRVLLTMIEQYAERKG
jgi:excisionase family DNA binding protein